MNGTLSKSNVRDVLQHSKDKSIQHSFFGRLLSYLESKKEKKIMILFNQNFDDIKKREEIIENLLIGFKLKDYRFEKYKNVSKKDFKIDEVRILGFNGKYSSGLERKIKHEISSDSVHFVRNIKNNVFLC